MAADAKRKPGCLSGGLLLGSGLVLALLVVELGLRLFWPAASTRYGYFPTHPMQVDPAVGWTFKPNFTVRTEQPDFEATAQFNSEGFRSSEAFVTGQAGDVLAVLGDSFTAALQVDESQTFVSLLGQELQADPLPSWPIRQVQNYGVTEDSTIHELLLYEQRVRPHRPGIVVVCLFANDFPNCNPALEPNPSLRPHYVLNDAGEVTEILPFQPAEGSEGVKQKLRWFAVYRFLAVLKHHLQYDPFRSDEWAYVDPWPDDYVLGWHYFQWALDRLVNDIRADGALPLVVFIPHREAVEDAGWQKLEQAFAARPRTGRLVRDRLPRELHQVIDPLRVDYLDLTAALRAATASGQELYLPRDGHLTVAGHEVVATALAATVRQAAAAHAKPLSERAQVDR